MRPIQKQHLGSYHLNQAHSNPPTTHQQATSRWRSFGYKSDVLDRLLDEQYQLCCYSELRADQEGLGYHIEHVENKGQNPPRTFDYNNLAASALDSANDLQVFKAQNLVTFGGHSPGKQAQVDSQRFVSCHGADCARFFAYLSDGRVVPSVSLNAVQEDQARYTIDILNLNSPFLITRRRQWWDELDAFYQEHEDRNWDLAALASVDLVPANGRLSRFFSLTRQFFGRYAEEALQLNAPALL
jgi:uncharacterized protein (TIGR02646 family)